MSRLSISVFMMGVWKIGIGELAHRSWSEVENSARLLRFSVLTRMTPELNVSRNSFNSSSSRPASVRTSLHRDRKLKVDR